MRCRVSRCRIDFNDLKLRYARKGTYELDPRLRGDDRPRSPKCGLAIPYPSTFPFTHSTNCVTFTRSCVIVSRSRIVTV